MNELKVVLFILLLGSIMLYIGINSRLKNVKKGATYYSSTDGSLVITGIGFIVISLLKLLVLYAN